MCQLYIVLTRGRSDENVEVYDTGFCRKQFQVWKIYERVIKKSY
jgi:hypothetical protein